MQRVREDFTGELGFGRDTQHLAQCPAFGRQMDEWPRNTRNHLTGREWGKEIPGRQRPWQLESRWGRP